MEEIAKYGENYASLEAFTVFLNKLPKKSAIKVNKYADNSLYLPIGEIEQKLDELYAGLWSTSNMNFQVVANSVVCSLQLRVFHPVAKIWLTRAGIGAVPIQLNKGEHELNFSTIKSDAIRKNAGASKAMAVRNAAQTLGAIFGRNLNREDVSDYTPLTEQVTNFDENISSAKDLLVKSTLADETKAGIEKQINNASPSKLNEIIKWLHTKQPQS